MFLPAAMVCGAATAIQAIADGKKAAVNINNYLGSQSGITVGEEIVLPELEVGKTSVLSAAKMNNLPIAERVTNQKEVAIGLTEQQVKDECGRCLKCHGTAKVDPSLCLNCSLCWELCTHGAISMEPLDTPPCCHLRLRRLRQSGRDHRNLQQGISPSSGQHLPVHQHDRRGDRPCDHGRCPYHQGLCTA